MSFRESHTRRSRYSIRLPKVGWERMLTQLTTRTCALALGSNPLAIWAQPPRIRLKFGKCACEPDPFCSEPSRDVGRASAWNRYISCGFRAIFAGGRF